MPPRTVLLRLSALGFACLVATPADAEFKVNHTYRFSGRYTMYDCADPSQRTSSNNIVNIYAPNEHDLLVYFATKEGVPMSLSRARSGGASGAVTRPSNLGGTRYTSDVSISGDTVRVRVSFRGNTAGILAFSYALRIGGASCQVTQFSADIVCGRHGNVKGAEPGHHPGTCEVISGRVPTAN